MSDAVRRPDVYLVVLDCVSVSAVTDLCEAGALPNIRELMSEAVCFGNAVATSPWTIPSHASLFTGAYPWNHGLFHYARETLGTDLGTVAEGLRGIGYESFFLSANPVLQDVRLTRGFARGLSGRWRDLYSRGLSPSRLTHFVKLPEAPESGLGPVSRSFPRRAKYLVDHFPLPADLLSRLFTDMLNGSPPTAHRVAPWIEPAFAATLRAIPPSVPAFGFINLLDAHEPYIGVEMGPTTLPTRVRLLLSRQDRGGWLRGDWTPRPEELANLRALYNLAVKTLDSRIGLLRQILREAGRWENSIFVLTSDHGQSLKSGETLYHQHGLQDELLRVPLYLRLPNGQHGGRVCSSWASLVDIAPTISDLTGCRRPMLADGVNLTELLSSQRAGPAYALADGLAAADKAGMNASRIDQLSRFGIAAYVSKAKYVHNFDIRKDPAARTQPTSGSANDSGSGSEPLAEEFHRLEVRVREIVSSTGAGPLGRLSSWGYA